MHREVLLRTAVSTVRGFFEAVGGFSSVMGEWAETGRRRASGGEPVPDPGPGWDEERVFFDGEAYFGAVLQEIRNAHETVDLEMYIFEPDIVGHRVAEALLDAARRGVRIRVVVDGAGSSPWRPAFGRDFSAAGIRFRVYHELPWDTLLRRSEPGRPRETLRQLANQVNRRDHRKLVVVDGRVAFTGSHNVYDPQCGGADGDPPWRDTSIRVTGDPVRELIEAFELVWRSPETSKPRLLGKRLHRTRWGELVLVRTNATRSLRSQGRAEFFRRMREARRRIWLTTGYFVPRPKLVSALSKAASRGVDVRLVIPLRSDIAFMPWVSTAFYRPLRRAGVRIFEYLPRNMHAKSAVIDDWHAVGTTNLNHRSFIHDLELDVVVTAPVAIEQLEERFRRDLDESNEVTEEDASRHGPVRRAVGRAFLSIRHWL